MHKRLMKLREFLQKKSTKKTVSTILIIGFVFSFTLTILSYYTFTLGLKMRTSPRPTSSFLANSEAALDKCNNLKTDNSLCIKLLQENTHREIKARKYLNHYQINEQMFDFFGLQLINPFYFSINIYENNLRVQLNSLNEQQVGMTDSRRDKFKKNMQPLIAEQVNFVKKVLHGYYASGGIAISMFLMLLFAKLTNSLVNNKVQNGINCMYVGERRLSLRKLHDKSATPKKD